MVVPKKVYLHAGAEKPRSRPRGANGRRRSFPFPFRSSAGDDSSISTNSCMDEEDDLQPVFQDVADALYKNTSPFMETTLIDFSKRAKSDETDDGDGDNESEARRRKEKKITLGRRSLKPKSRPELARSQRRKERPVGRKKMGANPRSKGQGTQTKQQPLVEKTHENTHDPFISITDKLSFESDEPIATERREPAVSVRTEELVNGKHLVATRQASFATANASQNRQQPTKRSSLPHNKPRRANEASITEKDNPVKVHLPTNRLLSHSDAFEGGNTEMPRSRSVNSKRASGATSKPTNQGRASGFIKSRSLRGRSPVNLEAIPAFSKSSSHGSRGRTLGIRRSLSRIRSRSKDNRERATSASKSSPSVSFSQQASISNASETVNSTIKLQPSKAQESQAAVDVATSLLAEFIRELPSELVAGLTKELGAFWSCSNWFEPSSDAATIDSRNDTSTPKETVDGSEQACEQREKSEETDLKSHETSASQAPENLTTQSSNKVTPLDSFRAYMNFMIAASKQQLTVSTSNFPSKTPSARESPPATPLAPAIGSNPTTTTTADQVSSRPPLTAAASARTIPSAPLDDKHGLPPLSPQKPTRRTRSGNLQMLRIRFRRDSSFGTRSGSRSGSSRASDSTRSLLIEN